MFFFFRQAALFALETLFESEYEPVPVFVSMSHTICYTCHILVLTIKSIIKTIELAFCKHYDQ